jgi:hypothetical protein
MAPSAVKVEPDWDLQTAIWYVMVTATTVGAPQENVGRAGVLDFTSKLPVK